ncbi:hypothetical protein DL765_010642 [Monosporascus sp. GIB2]|nr:hypothetical protein DL765_010642 [Monosporascus sp. GIB2]
MLFDIRQIDPGWNATASMVLNFNSPYRTREILHGQFAGNHTSNLAIVYEPRTIPVPWPFLCGSTGLSLLTALWGTYSPTLIPIVVSWWMASKRTVLRPFGRIPAASRPQLHWGVTGFITKGIPLLIGTVRSVAALVQSAQTVGSMGGRHAAPSALCMLMLSVMPYIADKGSPHRFINYLAILDVLCVFVSLAIMVYSRANPSAGFYSKLSVVNGTCPVVVDECRKLIDVGCLTDSRQSDLSRRDLNWHSTNMIGLSELALSIVVFAFGAIVLVVALYVVFAVFSILAWLCNGCRRQKSRAREQRHLSPEEIAMRRRKNDITLADLATWSMTAIVIWGAISIPLHYVQQVNPKQVYVMDGSGPEVPGYASPWMVENRTTHKYELANYNGENATTGSWSDCFIASTPTDPLGFWEIWWRERSANIESVLALV